jgi:hypothetical protein
MEYIFSVLQDFLFGFFIGAALGCIVVCAGLIAFTILA